jgi:hypothetical protein
MNGGGDYCGAFRELKRKENEWKMGNITRGRR